jgi:hypothetical protein
MIEWLSPTDFPVQQHDIITRRQEGTGQWFLESLEFGKWLQGSNKTLFCPGIPGAGKTMIAAIAIDHPCKTIKYNKVGVAFLYCNYKAQAIQSASNLLSALLKQLAHCRTSNATLRQPLKAKKQAICGRDISGFTISLLELYFGAHYS